MKYCCILGSVVYIVDCWAGVVGLESTGMEGEGCEEWEEGWEDGEG